MNREPPKIPPLAVKRQHEGQCWSEVVVRLPKDATFQDLNDPTIWSQVQGNRQVSLRRLDRVHLLAWDESWIASAIVTGASDMGVVLTKPVRTDLPPRSETLFEDPLYKVTWEGSGFGVRRKKDDQLMGPVVASRGQAEKDLRALYPLPAA